MKCKIDTVLGTIVWTAEGGETVTLEMGKCHAAIVGAAPFGYAAFHGMKQRCVDNAAISRDKTTGAAPTDAERLSAIREMVAHYHTGSENWSLTRAAAAPRQTADQMLAALLADPVKLAELAATVAAAQAKLVNATA